MNPASAPYELTPLEIACGFPMLERRQLPPLPEVPPGMTPRLAFERSVLPALQHAPCLVSFSGGRDSSAVLAVATAVARREGLPLPIPITHRFPAAAETDESQWQEQVVTHLGLDEWLRLEVADELDCVGPVASTALRRHGLLWPCNAYFHAPVFEAASGGTVLTGIGGDEALSPSAWSRQLDVLTRRVRPTRRDLPRVAYALSPTSFKARRIRRGLPRLWWWLQPEARRQAELWVAADAAHEPLRPRERYRRVAGSPATAVALTNLELLARDAGTAASHPLSDPLFLAALAEVPGSRRPRSRTEAMEQLVGDLLPSALVRRSTKASFGEVLWGAQSRAVMAEWDGEGVDPRIVEVERLRAEWSEPEPDTHTVTLLQSVWLARPELFQRPVPRIQTIR